MLLRTQIIVSQPSWTQGDVVAALHSGYLSAETKYLAACNDLIAGSCSLSVVLQNNTLHIANCGDCRAVLFKVALLLLKDFVAWCYGREVVQSPL